MCYFVLVFFSPLGIAITSLGEERANLSACFSYVCSVCACLDLSVSTSSWGLGRAAVCDCGTPWTFLLPFFVLFCSYVFSPFSIAITSLGEERAIFSAFRTFVRFALVWFCLFPLPLGVWEGLRFVIVALPGLFSYLFWTSSLLILYKVFVLIKDKCHLSLTNPKGSMVFLFHISFCPFE